MNLVSSIDEIRSPTYGASMAKYFTTTVLGRRIELPGTIRSIREALPEKQRAEFEREAEHAGADEIAGVLARWALRTPQAYDPDEEELIARLKSGDFSGVHVADESGEDTWLNRLADQAVSEGTTGSVSIGGMAELLRTRRT
ncbi:hypothetical protein I5Q34_05400 [Streptomyces sp. AV19]|uniref:hypothetical protein n=1 Tax=Streptomyces sp. AV19 TaxID=2793068 RepID=UPI0018FE99EA|nr:hypothetical protein [Streptomyces sp. AV19]MBH1933735.1 hypothetical protein [Streptomyces sp. AV19]MDG4535760.1 hypothetical protein [Streptomyces sp. AV19]